MAITGIVMMAYADNFHTDSIIGVAFAVGSASTSALYKVCCALFLCSHSLDLSDKERQGRENLG